VASAKKRATPCEVEERLKLDMIAVVDESNTSKIRTEEVRQLIAKMILLGRKKGRPSTKDREFEDAA
jgi:hypothetical protein